MPNISNIYTEHIEELASTLAKVDPECLSAAANLIQEVYKQGRTIFVAGNGGSAATASHMAADFSKTTLGAEPLNPQKRLRTIALCDNVPLLTAYSNDVSFKAVFGEQLRTFASEGDLLIVISASGDSENIIFAIECARRHGVKSVGLLGFGGGKARSMVDVAVLAPSRNLGVIEDCHSIFMHALTNYLKTIVVQ